MINLDKIQRETAWIDLPHGVRVRVRPYDGVVWELARLKSFELAARVVEESRAAADLGADDLALPGLDDPLARQAVGNALFTVALAQAVVVAWEGVGQGDQPAPVEADTIAALLRVQGMADAFMTAYDRAFRVADEAAEGNG